MTGMMWDTDVLRYAGERIEKIGGIESANAGRESEGMTKAAAQVRYVATVSFPDGDPVQIRFTADANLDDAALYAAAQAAAEEEYYGPLTVGNIDEYDPTPLARRTAITTFSDVAIDYYLGWCRDNGKPITHSNVSEWWRTLAPGDQAEVDPVDVMETLEEYGVEYDDSIPYEQMFPTGSRKTASTVWDSMTEPRHKVAGWDWDERLSGYVADAATDFACVCGSNVEAPGYCACRCGKVWNSYQITANGSTRLICREVPMRADAVLSSRDGPSSFRCGPHVARRVVVAQSLQDELYDRAEKMGLWDEFDTALAALYELPENWENGPSESEHLRIFQELESKYWAPTSGSQRLIEDGRRADEKGRFGMTSYNDIIMEAARDMGYDGESLDQAAVVLDKAGIDWRTLVMRRA